VDGEHSCEWDASLRQELPHGYSKENKNDTPCFFATRIHDCRMLKGLISLTALPNTFRMMSEGEAASSRPWTNCFYETSVLTFVKSLISEK
jgi:hypothetical protein